MPQKPLRPCPGAGNRRGSCPNLIRSSERYCSECEPFVKKTIHRYDRIRDQTPGRKFLHSSVWRKIRLEKLKRDPLCEICLLQSGVVTAANIVHHIDENELNNDPKNHQSVCMACHNELHRNIAFGNDKK